MRFALRGAGLVVRLPVTGAIVVESEITTPDDAIRV